MAIVFQDVKKLFTLHTRNSSYQMMVDEYNNLLHLYYGAKNNGEMDYLLTYYDRGFSANPYEAGMDRTYSLDALPQEYPTWGTGDYRNTALVVKNTDGSECTALHYVSHTISRGKYSLKGLPAVYASEEEAETLEILMEDAGGSVQVRLLYGVLEDSDIITRSAVIENISNGEIILEKTGSACLDFMSGQYDLITFYGRHTMERNMQRGAIDHGTKSIGSRRGGSSHQYNPGVIICDQGTTETAGDCYGMLFVYSGNFLCEAEKDQYDQTRILMGLQSDLFHYPLQAGEALTVPETILSYSGEGLEQLSNQYHRCIRDHICRGRYSRETRPVLLNSWEAAYFEFTAETICNLAKEAADLDIDMVVMDDGWFGNRNSDDCALGDWQVNEEKLGCSLGEMIKRINDIGVKFGIWIEPEMVSEESTLYKEHPDWAMQIPGRKPVRGRMQLMLDFSRKEVRDTIFDQICQVLDQGNVEYVKWDMNRHIAEYFSQVTAPGKVSYDFVLGVYEFLERMIERYPDMLIEGCSGGGGRFDAGMLYYTPQIWCSDNTDAMDRLRIQYGTSFFYPACTVGSHVSAVPNHQTGRKTRLATRGITAMAGTFGYEMDPGLLTEVEKEEIREQVKQFKEHAELIRSGSYYRLSNPFTAPYSAWEFAAEDGSHALLSVVIQEIHGNMAVNYVKLRGLIPDAIYEEAGTGARYTGAALMHGGLPMPIRTGSYRSYQYCFVKK